MPDNDATTIRARALTAALGYGEGKPASPEAAVECARVFEAYLRGEEMALSAGTVDVGVWVADGTVGIDVAGRSVFSVSEDPQERAMRRAQEWFRVLDAIGKALPPGGGFKMDLLTVRPAVAGLKGRPS